MIIFVNNKDEIKAVGSTNNVELTGKVIDDDDNPFSNWSDAKICCYKATVIGGKVTMMTPYVDSRIIEHIEQLGKDNETNAEDIADVREGIMETFEMADSNYTDTEDLRNAIEEIYEMLLGEEEE